MEAARLPMICFDQKNSSDKTKFTSVLLKLISTHFEEDSSGYARECEELDKLRSTVIYVPVDYAACGTLKRYYCQLCFLLNRFPFLVGTSVPGLEFTWEDTYQGNSSSHSEVEFEKAAVLYNIGAMHSFLGISDNRSSPEGMKISCTHLQCAAWAFQQVRDNFNSGYAADWSFDILSFQEQTMLAQSQECILEKSMTDNRKASITAKVAAQCVEFYKAALRFLESSNPTRQFGSSQVKEWKRHLELKINFMQCVMYYYLTLQAEDQQSYGERLAYAHTASKKLAECVKLSQTMGDDVKTSIQYINDVVTGKYIAAKKENDFVYHEKMPDIDSLPEVKGAVLVKGIGFDVSDKAVSGPDIFAKLVPMEAHEASSLYSEEKAKLLRDVGGRLEEHDTVLAQYLASLQIDVDKLLPQFDTIPDVLVEKCAAISVRPDTMKDLNQAMTDLATISTATMADIDETERILQEEKEEEEEFQTKYGKRRQLVMIDEISGELDKCKQAFTKASQSNADLHKAMNLHIKNLNLLSSSLEEIKAELPNPQSVLNEEETTVVARIKQLSAKIDEMRTQRSALFEKLRTQVMADDITKNIVTRGSDDTKELFAAQLKKHDSLIEEINLYMTAQPKILEALDQANVNFVPIKQKIDMTLQQRGLRVEALVYSYDVYEDLLDKQQKGMQFYQKLQQNIQRLLEKTTGLHSAQKKERDMITEKMKPKGPPPARPTATKPNASLATPGNKDDMPKSTSGPPKLKDYLPFMKAGGSSAAAAIDALADNGSVDDGFDDLDDLDDVELPDISATPKLKDFLPFMAKGKPGAEPVSSSRKDTALAGGAGELSELAPQLLKYLPQNMKMSTAVPLTQTAGGNLGYRLPSNPQKARMPSTMTQSHVPIANSSGLLFSQSMNVPNSSVASAGLSSQQPFIPSNSQMRETFSSANHMGILSPGPQSPRMSQQPAKLRQQSPQVSSQPPLMRPQLSHMNQRFPQQMRQPSLQFGQQPLQHPQKLEQHPRQLGQQPQQLGQQPQQLGQQPQHMSQHSQQSEQQPQQFGQPPHYMGQTQQMRQQPQQMGQQYQSMEQQTQEVSQHPHQVGQSIQQMGQQSQQMTQQPQQLGQYPQQMGQQPRQMGQQPRQMGQQQLQQMGQQHRQAGQQSQQMGQQNQQMGQQHQQMGQQHQQMGQQHQQMGQQHQQIGQQHQQMGQPKQLGQAPQQMGLLPQEAVPLPQQLEQHSQQMGQQPGQMEQQPQQMRQQPQQMEQLPQQMGQLPQQLRQKTQQLEPHAQQGEQHPQGVAKLPQKMAQQPQQMGQQRGQHTQLVGQWSHQRLQQPQQIGQQFPQIGPHTQQLGQQAQQIGQQPQQIGQQTQQIGQGLQQMGQRPPQMVQLQHPQMGQAQQSVQDSQQPGQRQLPFQRDQVPTVSQQTHSLQGEQVSDVLNMQAQESSQLNTQSRLTQDDAKMVSGMNQPSVQASQMNISNSNTFLSTSSQHTFSSLSPSPAQPKLATSSSQQFYSVPISNQNNIQYKQPLATSVSWQNPLCHSQPQLSLVGNSRVSTPTAHPLDLLNSGTNVSSTVLTPINSTAKGVIAPGVSNLSRPELAATHLSSEAVGQPQDMTQVTMQAQQVTQQPQQMSQAPQHLQNVSQPQQNAPQQQQNAPHQQQNAPQQQQNAPQQQQNAPKQQQNAPQQQQRLSQQTQQIPHQSQQPSPQGQPASHSRQQLSQQGQQLLPQTEQLFQQSQHVSQNVQQIPQQEQQIFPQTSQSTHQSETSGKNLRNWPQNQSGGLSPGNQNIPVLAVSPQRKSHVSDLEGVSISSSSHLESSFVSDIDWSKASLAPKTTKVADVVTAKTESASKARRDSGGHHGPLSRQGSRENRDNRDPYADEASLEQFVSAVERYVKQLESLTKPSLKGPTPLDKEWQDMCEEQERESKRNSTAAGLSESTRNRHPDVLPYDKYRVILSDQKNDYINASLIETLSAGCPRFIAAQGPLGQTEADFWSMIVLHKVEYIIMLSRWTENDHSESARYWPRDRGDRLSFGNLLITLQLANNHKYWTERRIAITNLVTKDTHICTQLQFNSWPSKGLPEPMPLLMLVKEATTLYKKQRSSRTPIIVHCGNGISKTGVFCTLYNAVAAVNSGQGITSIAHTVGLLRQRRRGMVSTQDEYLFCHTALLYYAQDILVKRGILTSQASFSNSLDKLSHKQHGRTPSNDFIMSDTSLALIGEFSASSLREASAHLDPAAAADKAPVSASLAPSIDKTSAAKETPVAAPQKGLGSISNASPKSSPALSHDGNVDGESAAVILAHEKMPTTEEPLTTTTSQKDVTNSNAPLQLPGATVLDIANPQTFEIGKGRQRITKADFASKTGGLKSAAQQGDDPFSSLDPMWSLSSK
ncbi:uncharacterized protein [Watersipora subatra]|uniref:uncharacterized protein n=1 Tax=Watersipora subatra TaxID=2589382 RepID=UPI00355BA348